MADIVITYGRAFKIWWSYLWRAFVLFIPASLLILPLMFWILPFPTAGQPTPQMHPAELPALMGKMFGVWLVMMVLNVLLQVQAMRWMLKTQWRDFRLKAVTEQ